MRKSDFSGPYGEAWRLDIDKISESMKVTNHCIVGAWVVHAPLSHPFWPWYRLILIHLRAGEQLKAPMIYLRGATHEFCIEALDPEHYPPSVDEMPSRTLSPMNFASQLICTGDRAAVTTIEYLAITDIVVGKLNPDTDGIRGWIDRFGDNLFKGSQSL